MHAYVICICRLISLISFLGLISSQSSNDTTTTTAASGGGSSTAATTTTAAPAGSTTAHVGNGTTTVKGSGANSLQYNCAVIFTIAFFVLSVIN